MVRPTISNSCRIARHWLLYCLSFGTFVLQIYHPNTFLVGNLNKLILHFLATRWSGQVVMEVGIGKLPPSEWRTLVECAYCVAIMLIGLNVCFICMVGSLSLVLKIGGIQCNVCY